MLRIIGRVTIGLILVVLFSAVALCQEMKEIPIDKAMADKKRDVLNEIQGGAMNTQRVEEYLRKYYLARWTHLSNAKDLHNYRIEMAADIASLPDAGKKSFMDILAKNLTIFAANKSFYPACRYNAVLAIADMNIKGGTPPVPYAGVLKRLCDFCDSDKVQLPDYVRLAALVGVVRHTELGISNVEDRNMVHAMLLRLLSPEYIRQKHYRAEVMTWFELKAMEGLNNLRSVGGPKGQTETLDAFRAIIERKGRSLDVRCLAARGIGAMNLASAKNYDYPAVARAIAKLAMEFCEEDLKFIEEEALRDQIKGNKDTPSGGMTESGGMGMEMEPGMSVGGGTGFTAPTDKLTVEKIQYIIARVKFDFDSILQAINGTGEKTGVKAVLTDKEKDLTELLNKVSVEIKKTFDFLDNGNMGPGAKAPQRGRGRKKQASAPSGPKVDIPLIKDHLKEQLIRYKELLGIDSN